MEKYLPQGARIWQQPPLEAIVREMRSLSPSLQEAEPEDLVRLLVRVARGGDGFTTLMNKLGAGSDAGKVRGAIADQFASHPFLPDYMTDLGNTPHLDASGVPTYKSYKALRFDVPPDTWSRRR